MKIVTRGRAARRLASRAAELSVLALLLIVVVERVATLGGGASAATAATSAAAAGAVPAGCAISTNLFNASPKVNAQSLSRWTCSRTERVMTGNGIPDHAIAGGDFRTAVSAQELVAHFPIQPVPAEAAAWRERGPIGFALNSVKLDPGTDGSCSGTASSTARGAGCVPARGRDAWRLEAIGGAFVFGTDENNGHVQPNGQYHYHGVPEGYLLRAGRGRAMTLVGFAIDGYPIYARYGYSDKDNAATPLRAMLPSWQKKTAPDAGRPSAQAFPMGTFTSDFQYVAGSGDLDECNGRSGVTPEFPQGTYHYFITDSFPYIQRCLKGKT